MASKRSRSRRDDVATSESRQVDVPVSKAASEPVGRVAAVAAEAQLVEPSGVRRGRRFNSRQEFEARVDNRAKTMLD